MVRKRGVRRSDTLHTPEMERVSISLCRVQMSSRMTRELPARGQFQHGTVKRFSRQGIHQGCSIALLL
jgi:hypothetical protein